MKKETSEDLGILEGDDDDDEEEEEHEVQLCYMVYVMCDHVNSMISTICKFLQLYHSPPDPWTFLHFWKFWRWLSNGFNSEISGYWNWRLISGFWIIGRLVGIGIGD